MNKRKIASYDQDNLTPHNKNLWKSLELKNKNKKRKLITNYDDYISATQIKNYILKDPLLDWFDLYGKPHDGTLSNIKQKNRIRSTGVKSIGVQNTGGQNTSAQTDIFCISGNTFEEKINAHLKRIFPNEIVTIESTENSRINDDAYNRTVQAMLDGIPLILQGVLINHTNKTKGITDILVRSDYINKLVNNKVVSDAHAKISAPKLGHAYHYLVVDIKWTTMTLCANGFNIRNDGRFPAYKGQLAIYTQIVGQIQGYTSSVAYVMAKAWKIDSKKSSFVGFNCFDLLGVIDYDGFDNLYVKKVVDSISWLNDVRKNGSKWKLLKPTRSEMYPNMSNKFDAPWTKKKKKLAEQLNEITQIWYVNDINRNNAHQQGIMSWKDVRCNSKNLGITSKSKFETINKILNINRKKTGKVEPILISNNIFNWQTESVVDFYVDFETLNYCFLEPSMDIQNSKTDADLIFMIGVGYVKNNVWQYASFIATDATFSEENRILTEFTNFIDLMSSELDAANEYIPRLFHWTSAEITNFSHALTRHNQKWSNWTASIVWVDMYLVFTSEPIVVHGALNFKLKTIANAMYALKCFKTTWNDNGVCDGLSAMISAINLYKQKINNPFNILENKIMKDICKYNEVDCKVIWEINKYLRLNNCKKIDK